MIGHDPPLLFPALGRAVAVGTLVAAGPARADAPWSPPSSVQGSRGGAPTLTFDRNGLGLLAADSGGSAASGAVGPHTIGSVARDDAFGPLASLMATNLSLSGSVATYASTRFAGLGTHFSNRAGDRAGLILGPAGTKLTNVRWLGPAGPDGRAEALAANTRGDVAGASGCATAARAPASSSTCSCGAPAGRSSGRSGSTAPRSTASRPSR